MSKLLVYGPHFRPATFFSPFTFAKLHCDTVHFPSVQRFQLEGFVNDLFLDDENVSNNVYIFK